MLILGLFLGSVFFLTIGSFYASSQSFQTSITPETQTTTDGSATVTACDTNLEASMFTIYLYSPTHNLTFIQSLVPVSGANFTYTNNQVCKPYNLSVPENGTWTATVTFAGSSSGVSTNSTSDAVTATIYSEVICS